MNKRRFLLSLLVCLGDAFALEQGELIGILPATHCFTYLSTFLELGSPPTGILPPTAVVTMVGGTSLTVPASAGSTIQGGTTSLSANSNSPVTTAVPISTSTISRETTTIPGGTTSLSTNSNSPATAAVPITTSTISRETTTIPGGTTSLSTGSSTPTITTIGTSSVSSLAPSSISTTIPVAQPVIFLVVPRPGAKKRGLRKRVLGGFLSTDINGNRDSCNVATVFNLSQDQLFEGDNPVFYSPGETFKKLHNPGVAPNSAITRTFSNVGGVLRFTSPSIPSGEANFCQDSAGEVFITFTTRPADCQPIFLYAYRG
ncbi:hypothetical protein LZ31DRAFT_622067 [Colletotrichum somersetense]|nr:hypothetical protein LZ31DRAFT_622067 [Colletotrichum somersetense]